jgi:PIN domain nuclease of toxin-antitoxin system
VLLLLDTHILLALVAGGGERLPPFIRDALRSERNAMFASAGSLWEIAIKNRQGKLPLTCALDEWPAALTAFAIALMDIPAAHVLAEADPVPETKDPFDRLLLAICQVEKMRLVTLDRSLLDHPLTLRPASA